MLDAKKSNGEELLTDAAIKGIGDKFASI